MSYQAACPSCGATVVFALDQTLLKVCDYCNVAVARHGGRIEDYGRVADVIPTPSALQLGIEASGGRFGSFRLAGHLQLDYGAGVWDEWLASFADGSMGWLAEAQGRFYMMKSAPLPPVPGFSALHAGQAIDLGPPGVFQVVEVREATFKSARGELPFAAHPGAVLRFADLSGPQGELATLDYGEGVECEALYVGNEAPFADLGIAQSDLVPEEERRVKATAGAVSCTQCGGPLELRAPDETKRVACPWCGSLLDATERFKVLEVADKVRIKPLIPLGSRGTLRNVEWMVIGFMERSVKVEGARYPWREYLLHHPQQGFRWLTENNGHWSFVEAVAAGKVADRGRNATFRGTVFKHFQSGAAVVDHVLGEFYWAVSRGETAGAVDYVAPPRMLSVELSQSRSEGGQARASEKVVSLGYYLEPREVWAAFGLKGSPPARTGVAPNQPWTRGRELRAAFATGALALVALIVLSLASLGRIHLVHEATVTIPARRAPALEADSDYVSDPFKVPNRGNLAVKVKADVNNSWIYLDGALVNHETGDLLPFDVEVSYYHGRDSDGSWSEGSRTRTRYISAVQPGTYVLRLGPTLPTDAAQAGLPGQYQVEVRSGVPRLFLFVLAALAIGWWPLLLGWRRFRFEHQRWSESDHPWSSS